ncbi:hypothetical protein IX51_10900 [uncultured archaeon]|nr:hypothetical protein IX51_10900 [uncultured archaeon]HKJ96743.1 peptide-methionine (S)-S-oxide reductase MsrA [Thermoplasmataceae archaeon]
MTQNQEVAVLGGGCFWCTEAVFQEIEGVVDVDSGYAGGHTENPSYEEVCTGNTGHAEVVKVTFDPAVISYKDILEVFFSMHDPTSLNRQGNDIGTQYRSVIFYMDEEQKRTAGEKISEMEQGGEYKKPIVTAVEKFSEFYQSENYHKNYFKNNSNAAYCRLVISPKVEKFKKAHTAIIRRP